MRSFIRQSVNWAECIREGDPTQDQLPEWEDLPVAGHFKVAKPGSRNSRARASDSEQKNTKGTLLEVLTLGFEVLWRDTNEVR